MRKAEAIYVMGMFEYKDHQLYQWIRFYLKSRGIACYGLELYSGQPFGSYSFQKETERIQEIINDIKPRIIIAHSLGAYAVMMILPHLSAPIILLDPSLAIADIIMPNLRQKGDLLFYDDQTRKLELSSDFLESIKVMPLIEQLAVQELSCDNVCVVGAGRGSFATAELYHRRLVGSEYVYMPTTAHDFCRLEDKRKMARIIEKRLDLRSSRAEDDRTRFW